MRKLLFSVFTILVLIACSKDDDSNGGSNGLLSGQVFGVPFTADGGRADLDDEKIRIKYGFNGEGCETGTGSSAFRIEIQTLKTVGVHGGNVTSVAFDDGEGSFAAFFGEGVEAEIISLTETTVDFKVKAEDLDLDCSLSGRHQVTICE